MKQNAANRSDTFDFIEMWLFSSSCRWDKGINITINCNVKYVFFRRIWRGQASFSMYRPAPLFDRDDYSMYAAYAYRHHIHIHDVQKKYLFVEQAASQTVATETNCVLCFSSIFFFNIPKKFTGNACNYRPKSNASMSLISLFLLQVELVSYVPLTNSSFTN